MLRSHAQAIPLSAALAFGVLAAIYIFAGSARADLPQEQGHVDLQTEANIRLSIGPELGMRQPKPANAGDVNGDGIDDIIVGASPLPSRPETPSTGHRATFVVFGKSNNPDTFNLGELGALGNQEGFRIRPGLLKSDFGRAVAGAGDVNGDGLDDVIIAEPYKESHSGGYILPGAAYIVFGKRSATTVNVAALGDDGFKIKGYIDSVAGAGDINQDGLADVIVGQPGASSSYVVSGKSDNTDTVDPANLGTPGNTEGFSIKGAYRSGVSVAGVGDVNGDGIPDLMVGAPYADNSGVAYVIHGKDSPRTVYLGNLGNGGFLIRGEADGNKTGLSVAGAGDVNGDGLADVILGAHKADHNGRLNSGSAYVVKGKRSPDDVILANLGDQGFRIDGAAGGTSEGTASDKLGFSVAGVKDVNGGGYDDVVVGAVGAYAQGLGGDGAAYVIYGGPATTNVDVKTLGTRGIQMDGSDGRAVGLPVAAAGDFNGDGSPDVAIGSSVGSYYNAAMTHSAYVVYGFAGGTDNLPIPPDTPPKEAQSTNSQSETCTNATYENRLEVPREVGLADLVKGRGIKARVSANWQSSGELTVEIPGMKARYYKVFGKLARKKDKILAKMKVRVGSDPEDFYLVASGKARTLITRALLLKNAPEHAKLKVSLVTHSVVKPSLKRLNTQTVRALRQGKVKRTDTYVKTRRVVDRSLCGAPLVAKIKGPKETRLSSLSTRRGKKGSGTEVKVSCSEDCVATIGYRPWGRFEVGLNFRKPGQKKNRVLSTYKVKLKAGEDKTLKLNDFLSKKQRMLLVRGAKKKLYKNIKFKYFLEARTQDGRSDSSAGTTRVRLRFN